MESFSDLADEWLRYAERRKGSPSGSGGLALRKVIIESPYSGDVERSLRYLRACMAYCLAHDEAPFASHGLYTQPGVLDDDIEAERDLGIVAGFAWHEVADAVVVFTDLGVSKGMMYGIMNANKQMRNMGPMPIEFRSIGMDWDE